MVNYRMVCSVPESNKLEDELNLTPTYEEFLDSLVYLLGQDGSGISVATIHFSYPFYLELKSYVGNEAYRTANYKDLTEDYVIIDSFYELPNKNFPAPYIYKKKPIGVNLFASPYTTVFSSYYSGCIISHSFPEIEKEKDYFSKKGIKFFFQSNRSGFLIKYFNNNSNTERVYNVKDISFTGFTSIYCKTFDFSNINFSSSSRFFDEALGFNCFDWSSNNPSVSRKNFSRFDYLPTSCLVLVEENVEFETIMNMLPLVEQKFEKELLSHWNFSNEKIGSFLDTAPLEPVVYKDWVNRKMPLLSEETPQEDVDKYGLALLNTCFIFETRVGAINDNYWYLKNISRNYFESLLIFDTKSKEDNILFYVNSPIPEDLTITYSDNSVESVFYPVNDITKGKEINIFEPNDLDTYAVELVYLVSNKNSEVKTGTINFLQFDEDKTIRTDNYYVFPKTKLFKGYITYSKASV